ncbi:MAG: ChrR family anti-sigma-E factor [Alphaproteobacteria bacterium]
MTIHHHPDDELLVAYAAGELDEAWSLVIATHTALCPVCRSDVHMAEAVGAALLEDMPAAEMAVLDDAALARTLALAELADEETPPDASSAASASGETDAPGGIPILPQPLRDYAGGDADTLKWRRLGAGAFQVPLVTGRRGAPTARLLRFPAGTAVPEHGHDGMEMTLVLAGSYADAGAPFARGDVDVNDAEVAHRPVAGAGPDCICLTVTERPLRFRGLIARLAQPFIGV